jgi:hypothetical protein
MKLSPFRPIGRRDLIKTLGSAALLLPGLELFERRARAQAVPNRSKFAVFFYTPDGVNQNAFWPSGTTSSFTLSNTLSAFTPYRDKILILGPQMTGAVPRVGTGLTYNTVPPQHQAPVTLAARIGRLPYTNPQTSAVNKIDGPSIDQVIANAVKGDSTFTSLNFGLHPIGGDTPSDFNYLMDGTPLKRLAGADEAWSYVFGAPMGPAAMTPSADLAKFNAVSNFLHARFTVLRPSLSAADQATLDGHLTSLVSYEQRIKARLTGGTGGPAPDTRCTNPTRAAVSTDADSQRTGSDTQTLAPFFMDIIATAFACNLTKVASVTFGYPGGGDAGGLRMPWLGFTDPLHFVSHHGNDPTKLSRYQQMNAWVASQVAALMDRLAKIPSATGSGTALDETTIYWFNRHGDGDTHSNDRLPNVILGGTGGYFKMGRWLQLPATSPTKVLISIANAMGVNVPSFGSEAFADTSPLAGLTG